MVYSFAGDHDGENPASPLISANGALYGETGQGGASGNGTIYEINGSGGEHVLYNFKGGVGGANPGGGLFKLHGFLYGTTSNGGNVRLPRLWHGMRNLLPNAPLTQSRRWSSG